MEAPLANSLDNEPPQGVTPMQTQLKQIYEDLLARRITQQEALARIQALKAGPPAADKAALLAVQEPGPIPGDNDSFQEGVLRVAAL